MRKMDKLLSIIMTMVFLLVPMLSGTHADGPRMVVVLPNDEVRIITNSEYVNLKAAGKIKAYQTRQGGRRLAAVRADEPRFRLASSSQFHYQVDAYRFFVQGGSTFVCRIEPQSPWFIGGKIQITLFDVNDGNLIAKQYGHPFLVTWQGTTLTIPVEQDSEWQLYLSPYDLPVNSSMGMLLRRRTGFQPVRWVGQVENLSHMN